ncbi:hypothetical protein K458DRAFT_387657 [Lentithecium fluviatile CBS 122367]|uniref:BTB domain-containing protein n=1 Tax=Lentithecium fluviatile CBS 122367 TaxID=1168545 RepID=A0A6G1J596_9PLEO|nr:hypothetical protein K458DRAFT_387657 [Lentithecium fluviatile CBS 122367]
MDDQGVLVDLYLQLVYTGKLPLLYDTMVHDWEDGSVVHELYAILCRLYVFAEKARDATAKNPIIQALEATRRCAVLCALPGPRHINVVFGGTPKNSPARRLLVDMWGCGDLYL